MATTRLPFGQQHLAANATTTIKAGPCILQNVVINTKGATANTLTLYDSLTGAGTVIAVMDTTIQPGDIFYNVQCLIGLTAVVATGTAADITITYL